MLHVRQSVGHWAEGWIGVVGFLLFGVAVLAIALPMEGSTPISEVSQAVGHVANVRSLKGGVYFELKEPGLHLIHHSKAGNLGVVASELAKPAEIFRVAYRNTAPAKPIFSDQSFYTVISIRTHEKVILSEEQVKRGKARDNWIGVVMAAVFLVLGFSRAAWLLR